VQKDPRQRVAQRHPPEPEDRGHLPPHVELRLPAHALHPGADVPREFRDGQQLAQGGVCGRARVLLRLPQRHHLLHDRAGRPGPLGLAQNPAVCAHAARPRHRHEHQQRQGRAGGAAQSVVRIRPHAEIRHGKQSAGQQAALPLQGRQVHRPVDRSPAHRLLRLDDRPRRPARPVGQHSLPPAVLLRLRVRGGRIADEAVFDGCMAGATAGAGGGLNRPSGHHMRASVV